MAQEHDEYSKCPAPFGVGTKRFARIGFHPNLDISGAMKKEITKAAPGSYNLHKTECRYKKGISWDVKLELEEFSKFLGFRNSNILADRKMYKSLRGPGTNDTNDNLYKKISCSVAENKGFGGVPKCNNRSKTFNTPPPDTYQRKLNLCFGTGRKTFSKIPTFEWDGVQKRFKSIIPKYHLPPGLYVCKDGKNTADITKKMVSIRGPYDLFTGPRDDSTIKNHFAPPVRQGQDHFYDIPSDLHVLLHHPSKKRYGKFLKGPTVPNRPTNRNMLADVTLCYRDPNEPGPTHYNIQFNSIVKKPPALHPFDSSKVNARPSGHWEISPGPGRYSPKVPKCMKTKRQSWVFLSKIKRDLVRVQNYKYFKD